MNFELKILVDDFTVCKIHDVLHVDFTDEFCFVGKTDEELSLVCKTEKRPEQTIASEDGWRAFRIEGIIDFELTGVLAGILDILAEHKIGIFAVSTYNTDYILTKKENFKTAIALLKENGYRIV